MGGTHKPGIRITLDSLIDKQSRLTVRIKRMFDAYANIANTIIGVSIPAISGHLPPAITTCVT